MDRAGTTERLEAAQSQAGELDSQVKDLQQQLDKQKAAAAQREAASRQHLQRLAMEAARREREALLLRVQDEGVRMGSLSVMRAGPIGEHPTATEPLIRSSVKGSGRICLTQIVCGWSCSVHPLHCYPAQRTACLVLPAHCSIYMHSKYMIGMRLALSLR